MVLANGQVAKPVGDRRCLCQPAQRDECLDQVRRDRECPRVVDAFPPGVLPDHAQGFGRLAGLTREQRRDPLRPEHLQLVPPRAGVVRRGSGNRGNQCGPLLRVVRNSLDGRQQRLASGPVSLQVIQCRPEVPLIDQARAFPHVTRAQLHFAQLELYGRAEPCLAAVVGELLKTPEDLPGLGDLATEREADTDLAVDRVLVEPGDSWSADKPARSSSGMPRMTRTQASACSTCPCTARSARRHQRSCSLCARLSLADPLDQDHAEQDRLRRERGGLQFRLLAALCERAVQVVLVLGESPGVGQQQMSARPGGAGWKVADPRRDQFRRSRPARQP